jgi:hypothetical protein
MFNVFLRVNLLRILQPILKKVKLSRASSPSKDPVPGITAPKVDFEKYAKRGFRVTITKGAKLITIYRNLLARLLYERRWELQEGIVFLELHERLINKANQDPEFGEKYFEWLITVQNLLTKLKITNFPYDLTIGVTELISDLQPFLPSKNAYYGWKGNPVNRSYARITLRNPLLLAKKHFPKRYLGVGYRDKGNRRDLAKDGSPHWTEVAQHNGEIEDLPKGRRRKDKT